MKLIDAFRIVKEVASANKAAGRRHRFEFVNNSSPLRCRYCGAEAQWQHNGGPRGGAIRVYGPEWTTEVPPCLK